MKILVPNVKISVPNVKIFVPNIEIFAPNIGNCVLTDLNNPHFQGSIDDMKAEAETMIAAAKVEGDQIKKKGAEQVE